MKFFFKMQNVKNIVPIKTHAISAEADFIKKKGNRIIKIVEKDSKNLYDFI